MLASVLADKKSEQGSLNDQQVSLPSFNEVKSLVQKLARKSPHPLYDRDHRPLAFSSVLAKNAGQSWNEEDL